MEKKYCMCFQETCKECQWFKQKAYENDNLQLLIESRFGEDKGKYKKWQDHSIKHKDILLLSKKNKDYLYE